MHRAATPNRETGGVGEQHEPSSSRGVWVPCSSLPPCGNKRAKLSNKKNILREGQTDRDRERGGVGGGDRQTDRDRDTERDTEKERETERTRTRKI